MTCDLTNPIFTDEDAARKHFETLRWPDGPICPHCGTVNEATELQGESTRPGLYKCRALPEALHGDHGHAVRAFAYPAA